MQVTGVLDILRQEERQSHMIETRGGGYDTNTTVLCTIVVPEFSTHDTHLNFFHV